MEYQEVQTGTEPRRGIHGDRPGAYEPVIRIHNPAVNPGETVAGDIFISGYGEIGAAKIVCYPSLSVFDDRQCRWYTGHRVDEHGLVHFGGESHVGGAEGGMLFHWSGGVKAPGWKSHTMFYDIAEEVLPKISTEGKAGRSPIEFELTTRRGVRPGQYSLTVVITYYNGVNWCTCMRSANFAVRNLLQRYEYLIASIALVAAIATIGADYSSIWDRINRRLSVQCASGFTAADACVPVQPRPSF